MHNDIASPAMTEKMTELKPDVDKRKMPVWLMAVFAVSNIIFLGFMALMGVMLLSGSD